MDLNAIFAQLGAKPKVKNKEELETWMEEYIRAKHSTFKQEPRSPADRGNNPNQPIIHIGRKPWRKSEIDDLKAAIHQLTTEVRELKAGSQKTDTTKRQDPGSHYFSVLDMKSGYYQVEIEEEHKERTAFTVGPLGFYEYNRLPFGLTNSPATYQRLMEDILGDFHMKICLIYLDDIIIFARTYEEHKERLQKVFQRLREAGLKLAPKKCHFCKEKVVYVGHTVSAQGIGTDPAKTEVIRDWPTPSTPEEVRRFLGFAGFYRKYVKDFSKLAAPLTALMPSPLKQQKGKRKQHQQKPWQWGAEEDAAFNRLKDILSSPPVLGYADYTLPFELHTDASRAGLGAVLYQEREGVKRVIAYASRALGKAERNYPAHKLEFLALKWAFTEKFRDYLHGAHFTVYTDNNPLTYVLTSAKLDATGHRWLAALSAFDFNIKYKPGLSNVDADTLSRLPHNTPHEEEITAESLHTICGAVTCPVVESLCLSAAAVDSLEDSDTQDLSEYTDMDWRRVQNNDTIIGPWLQLVRNKGMPNYKDFPSTPENAAMYKNYRHFRLRRGALYRQTTVDGEERLQLRRVFVSLEITCSHPVERRVKVELSLSLMGYTILSVFFVKVSAVQHRSSHFQKKCFPSLIPGEGEKI
nr:hypothetical protein BaRGS_022397 [Batillaria attramentaria]